MLTPSFDITQTEEFLIITVHAKYAKVAESEVYFHENDFKFYSKPYFLRLTLPGEVKSVDECDYSQIASYDVDSGIFTITILKKNYGQHFEGLELLTKLLAVPKNNTSTPNIEVLGDVDCDSNFDEDFDWHVEQNIYNEADSLIGNECYYGFANKKCAVLSRLQEELIGIIDVKDPNLKSPIERRTARICQENHDFSDDHYLADLYENQNEIDEFLSFETRWDKLQQNPDKKLNFSEDEKFVLKELPKREYLLTAAETQSVALGLVDLIYSYAYQHRTTLGDNNVESGWTISKLSPVLSWFETHRSLKNTVISVIRRSLTYPLYRNWRLSQRILSDVRLIFSQGQKQILKCLLEIRRIFCDCDSRFIFNDLYIIDYCVWSQLVSETIFKSLAKSLSDFEINKRDVDFDLLELELAAEQVNFESLSVVEPSSSNHNKSTCNPQADLKQMCDTLENVKLDDNEMENQKEEKETVEEKDIRDDSEDSDSDSSGSDSDSGSSDSDASGHYYLDSDDDSAKGD